VHLDSDEVSFDVVKSLGLRFRCGQWFARMRIKMLWHLPHQEPQKIIQAPSAKLSKKKMSLWWPSSLLGARTNWWGSIIIIEDKQREENISILEFLFSFFWPCSLFAFSNGPVIMRFWAHVSKIDNYYLMGSLFGSDHLF